jgi:hypothetical protein
MLRITQLVDIPYVFKRLYDAPRELADARSRVVTMKGVLKQAQAELTSAQAATLDANKDEYFALKNEAQRDLYRSNLYASGQAHVCAETVSGLEQAVAEADLALANLGDELTGLRYTVRLLEAVIVGQSQQEQHIASVALEDTLRAGLHERVSSCLCPEGPCPGPKPCDHEGAARPCVPGEQDDVDDELPF